MLGDESRRSGVKPYVIEPGRTMPALQSGETSIRDGTPDADQRRENLRFRLII